MTRKARKPSRLARELKEMGDALHRLGALSDDEHTKITMRHTALHKIERTGPLSPGEIVAIREAAHMSSGCLCAAAGCVDGYAQQMGTRGAQTSWTRQPAPASYSDQGRCSDSERVAPSVAVVSKVVKMTNQPNIRVTTYDGPGAEPVMREVAWPKVPPKGALIQIGACGVCGTDQHILKGHWPKPLPWPFTLGHELAGVVVEIGSELQTDFMGKPMQVGSKVMLPPLDAVRLLRLVQALPRDRPTSASPPSTTAAISASTSRRTCGAAGPSTSMSTWASCPAPRSTSCPTTWACCWARCRSR